MTCAFDADVIAASWQNQSYITSLANLTHRNFSSLIQNPNHCIIATLFHQRRHLLTHNHLLVAVSMMNLQFIIINVCFLILVQTPCDGFFTPNTFRHKVAQKDSSSLSLSTTSPSDSLGTWTAVSDSSSPLITMNHKPTNTTLLLLGCLHGAPSSADDVMESLISEPDVLVLELCPTRYKDLCKYMDRNGKENKYEYESKSKITKASAFPTLKVIQRTIEARGIGAGIATAVLGFISGLTSTLSGFEPGLEFTTALDLIPTSTSNGAPTSSDGTQSKSDWDLILADQTVDETLRRVGSLPKVSFDLWRDYLRKGLDWDSTYGLESKTLQMAIWGNDENDECQHGIDYVDMGRVLRRKKNAIIDLIRLTVPPVLVLELIPATLGSVFRGDASVGSMMGLEVLLDVGGSISNRDLSSLILGPSLDLIVSLFVVFLGYIFVALPAVKVVLRERDAQLSDGIREACQIAAEKQDSGRVVAVLGLLHVNGVARRLLED